MNQTQQGYEGGLFHPDLGNEVVIGRIFVDRWGLRFESESVSETIPVEQVEVELDENGDRISFRDPSRPELQIFTSDHSVLDHPSFASVNHIREQLRSMAGRGELSRRLRLLGYFVVGCIFLTWFCSWSLGLMVRSLASRVPPEYEREFGAAHIKELRKDRRLVNDPAQVAKLTALVEPLIQGLPPDQRNLKFFILKDSSANAYALPGGYVVVHTGLLDQVERPEELLGVLAHEIAHVTEKHVFRGIISAAGPIAIFRVFLHSKSPVGNVLTLGSGLMVVRGFSQEYEIEADEVGWKYLVAAKIDPRGMISIFRKWQAEEGDEEGGPLQAFSTHPATKKRIARLEKKWKKLPRGAQFGFIEITNPVPKIKLEGFPSGDLPWEFPPPR